VQLYVEGPPDKVVTFLEVRSFRKEVRIPKRHQDLPSLAYLGGKTLGALLTAELRGTEAALTAAGRPNFAYQLPRVSAHAMGQLIYLFEFQTALSGELYDVDAFDQPGVEAGKVATYALMGRAGYEEAARRLRADLARPRAVV
jgi:glucose-6-phosphate isomerase